MSFEKKIGTIGSATTEQMPTNLAQAIAESNGSITNVATKETFDVRPYPTSLNASVSSAANVDAVEKEISLFNEDFLDASPTQNNLAGNGGGAITKTYNDGRSGKVYNKMLEHARGGKGVKIKAITAVAKQISTGTPDETFFAGADMKVLVPTGKGSSTVPLDLDWQEAINNQPNKDGIYKLKVNFALAYVSQVKFNLSPDTKVDLIFHTEND